MRYLLSVCLLSLCSFGYAACPQCILDSCKDCKDSKDCKCGDACKCKPGKQSPDCKCGPNCPCIKGCDKKECDKGCACGKDCKCKPGKRSPDCKCGVDCPCAKVKCPKGCKSLAEGRVEAAKSGKIVILWIGCTDTGLQSSLTDFVHCYEEKVPGLPCPCVAVPSVRVRRFGRTQAVWHTFGCQPLPTANQLRLAAMPANRRGVPLVPRVAPVYPIPVPIPSRDWTSPDSPDASRRQVQAPINRVPAFAPSRGSC
jgi:hypothetical protein